MCGDYYIGGRRFSSLSDLIGYYSYVSCLLKGEKLLSPVAPPEVRLNPRWGPRYSQTLSFLQHGLIFNLMSDMTLHDVVCPYPVAAALEKKTLGNTPCPNIVHPLDS